MVEPSVCDGVRIQTPNSAAHVLNHHVMMISNIWRNLLIGKDSWMVIHIHSFICSFIQQTYALATSYLGLCQVGNHSYNVLSTLLWVKGFI